MIIRAMLVIMDIIVIYMLAHDAYYHYKNF